MLPTNPILEATLGQFSYIFIQMYSWNDCSYKILGKIRFFLKIHQIFPENTWKIPEIFGQQLRSAQLAGKTINLDVFSSRRL